MENRIKMVAIINKYVEKTDKYKKETGAKMLPKGSSERLSKVIEEKAGIHLTSGTLLAYLTKARKGKLVTAYNEDAANQLFEEIGDLDA